MTVPSFEFRVLSFQFRVSSFEFRVYDGFRVCAGRVRKSQWGGQPQSNNIVKMKSSFVQIC
jgi:hypothetical protein